MRLLALVGFAVAVSAPALVAAPARGSEPQARTWNFQQAHVPAAQPAGRDGAGVTVAVVDSWIDWRHPAFGGRFTDLVDCVGSSSHGCRDHTQAPDRCVHGTHVAGTVGSSTYGVAPSVRLLGVQVLGYDPSSGECTGTTTDVAAGIRWAATHGAQVVNLSVGELVPAVFQDPQVTAAVHDAARAGVVVVVAAGNASAPLTDDYAADALLVAATGPNGHLASYSDYGGSVALAAPGGDDGWAGLAACSTSTCIYSTEPDGRYGLLEGTSMAAPHVSGTAALLLGQAPGRGRADVIETLEDTARPLAGAGHGLLDAAAALTAGGHAASPAPAAGTGASSAATPGSSAPPSRGDRIPATGRRPTGPTSHRHSSTAAARTVAGRASAPPSTGQSAAQTRSTQTRSAETRSARQTRSAQQTGAAAGSRAAPWALGVAVAAIVVLLAADGIRRHRRRTGPP